MKLLKVLLITVIIVIVIAAIALVVFIKTFDANRYKGLITDKMSQQLGTNVELDEVSLNFSVEHGMNLKLKDFKITDLDDFSKGDAISIKAIRFDVDVQKFISNRQVYITSIEIISPRLNFVQRADSEVNIAKIFDQKRPGQSPNFSQDQSEQKAIKQLQEFDISSLNIKTIKIIDGSVVLNDLKSDPPMIIPVKDIDLEISDVALDKPFSFKMGTNIFGNAQNVHLNGKAQFNTNSQQLYVSDLQVQSKLSDYAIDDLKRVVPLLDEIGVQERIEGDIRLLVNQVTANATGFKDLKFKASLTDGRVKLKDLLYPIENIDARLEGTEKNLKLNQLFLYLASGIINIKGEVVGLLEENKANLDVSLQDVRLNELTSQENLPYKVEGKLFGEMRMQIAGQRLPSIIKSAKGVVNISVKEGKVLDINILKLVLDKISFIPDLAERVQEQMPEEYKEKLKNKDTELKRVVFDGSVEGKDLFIKQMEVDADGFLLQAQGRVDVFHNISLSADFYIPQEFSSSMVGAVEDLSILLDETERIHIPLKSYSGKLKNFKMYPDVKDLGKAAIKNKGKQELRKAIFKALDLDEVTPPTEEEPQEEGELPAEQTPSPEEVLIEGVLDAIFK